jgi:hypothetical protein
MDFKQFVVDVMPTEGIQGYILDAKSVSSDFDNMITEDKEPSVNATLLYAVGFISCEIGLKNPPMFLTMWSIMRQESKLYFVFSCEEDAMAFKLKCQ